MKVKDYIEIKISKEEIKRIVDRKVQDELNQRGVPAYIDSIIRSRISALNKKIKILEDKLKGEKE